MSKLRVPRAARVLAVSALAMAVAISLRAVAQGRPPVQSILVSGREAVAGEVLVKFVRELPVRDRLQVELLVDAEESEAVGFSVRRLRSRTLDVQALVDFLRTHPGVEYVEPNYIWHATAAPNDPQFPNLWGLRNVGQTVGGQAGTANADIHAASAWGVATGSRANVVAVVDTGVDYTHSDLAANIWSAPIAFTVTVGGATITCAAGTHGFNAIAKTCDPRDDNNHGTHVSGTIG